MDYNLQDWKGQMPSTIGSSR